MKIGLNDVHYCIRAAVMVEVCVTHEKIGLPNVYSYSRFINISFCIFPENFTTY
jgi:hypothetical protein